MSSIASSSASQKPTPSFAPNPTRILFQGDSITDAFRKSDEINPAYQLGNGYVFIAAARLALKYPGRYEFFNRGISGETVQHLNARWQEDALDLKPDILSLLVGVNSVIRRSRQQESLPDTEILATYKSLLSSLKKQNPALRILILEPFLLPIGIITPQIIDWLAPLQKGIAAIAREYNADFIPLQTIFNKSLAIAPAEFWAYDGIHPTHAGFELIAQAWLDAFTSKIQQVQTKN